MLHRFISSHARRALTTAETAALIAAVSSGVGIVGVATVRVIIGPGEVAAEPIQVPDEIRLTIEALDAIVAGSKAMMFVSRSEGEAATSLALWIDDSIDPGRVNLPEVLILDHSPLLRSLSTWIHQPERGSVLPGDDVAPERVGLLISSSDVQAFRELPDVRASVIAVGVERMEIVPVAPGPADSADGAGAADGRMRLQLTWRADSTDSEPVTLAVPTPLPARRP